MLFDVVVVKQVIFGIKEFEEEKFEQSASNGGSCSSLCCSSLFSKFFNCPTPSRQYSNKGLDEFRNPKITRRAIQEIGYNLPRHFIYIDFHSKSMEPYLSFYKYGDKDVVVKVYRHSYFHTDVHSFWHHIYACDTHFASMKKN